MEKITIKELAPYLPYGLRYYVFHDPRFLKKYLSDNPNGKWCPLMTSHNMSDKLLKEKYKPILRPLSDLTKEITHNGEKFVPIEIFEIGDDGGYNYDFGGNNVKLINTLAEISKHNIVHDISYLPFQVVQELIKHHFDVFGLIERGLAINVNELEENPYK